MTSTSTNLWLATEHLNGISKCLSRAGQAAQSVGPKDLGLSEATLVIRALEKQRQDDQEGVQSHFSYTVGFRSKLYLGYMTPCLKAKSLKMVVGGRG